MHRTPPERSGPMLDTRGAGSVILAVRRYSRTMKLNRSLFRGGIAAVVLSVAVTVLATRHAQPPRASEVAGVYSGYGDQVEFLRLELDSEGAGYLSVSYLPDSPARLYRVESW